jgi:hypothetical protein
MTLRKTPNSFTNIWLTGLALNKRFVQELPIMRKISSLTTLFATSLTSTAHAAGIGVIADQVRSNLQNLGDLVVAGGFLAGIVLMGAGLVRLKAAADSGGVQVKYSEGLWRLAVGGGLVALPAVTGVGVDTIFGEGGGEAARIGDITID